MSKKSLGTRIDPYKNYKFRVEIDGIVAQFCSVDMGGARAEVIEYREGTDVKNHSKKLPGRVCYDNIILRRGTTSSMDLYNWWKSVKDGSVSRRNMSIILLDDTGQDVCRWNVVEAWPVAYEPGQLEAEGNDVLIERLEVAHEGIERSSR